MPITQGVPYTLAQIPSDDTGNLNNANGTGQPQTSNAPGTPVTVTQTSVVLNKLTPGGANGSVTLVNGNPTAYTAPT